MEGRVIDAEQAISQLSFSVISILDTANIDAEFDGYDLVLNTNLTIFILKSLYYYRLLWMIS